MTMDQDVILAKMHQLPSLPLAVQAVIASFSDPNLDTVSLAQKIAQDQGLSARVLRVANSPFYGLPRKIGSIQDAVMVLGFDTVRSLVMSAGMVQAFSASAGSTFDRQAYWQRSFRVAITVKALATQLHQGAELAFTAGMFYDIGQLVLDLCMPQQFSGLLQQQAESGLDLIEIEQSALGFDHAQIGAELIRLWNFPPEIEQVVRDWRHPERSANPLPGIIHIAVLVESGLTAEALMTKLPEQLIERMTLTWARIESCLPSAGQMDAADSLVH